MKIGIIREGKVPTDKRVALSPKACIEALEKFPKATIVVQKSHIRCYKDQEYQDAGLTLVEDVSDCDILLGIKEVPIDDLISQKICLFFSHTIKKQHYNRDLLNALLRNHIQMVDYETLVNDKGQRVIAFGRYAGLVGAYNGVMTYGKKYKLFNLTPAHKCFDLEEMKQECKKASLPPVKIVVTGGGRVAQGAMETLNAMGVRKVKIADFLENKFDDAVYVQLDSQDYHYHSERNDFESSDFFANPENYSSSFERFISKADILIAAAYWHPQAPVLFTKAQMQHPDFNIKVIADITCDIEGSIPSTKRPSTIDDPIYDYNAQSDKIEVAFSSQNHVTVMAVDNLPNELPRDASDSFGRQLIDHVLPELLGNGAQPMVDRASITKKGRLTERYEYLQAFAKGEE